MREKRLHCTRVTRQCAVSIFAVLLLWQVSAIASALTLATWNIRWLNSDQYAPPPSREGERSDQDYRILARYATALDADLIALQEIGDLKALKRLFPTEQYQLLLSAGSGYHRLALAVKKPLHIQRHRDYIELGNSGGRIGLDITLELADGNALRLLVVHLKSGCSSNRAEQQKKRNLECARFAQDLAYLERWIDLRALSGEAFVVLGDFNRQLANTADRAWLELDDQDPEALILLQAPRQQAQSICRVQLWDRSRQRWRQQLTAFKQPIDFLLLGGAATAWQQGPAELVPYRSKDALRYNLSDHCPLKLRLHPQKTVF